MTIGLDTSMRDSARMLEELRAAADRAANDGRMGLMPVPKQPAAAPGQVSPEQAMMATKALQGALAAMSSASSQGAPAALSPAQVNTLSGAVQSVLDGLPCDASDATVTVQEWLLRSKLL